MTNLHNHLCEGALSVLRRLVNSKARQWGLGKLRRRWVLARILGEKPPVMSDRLPPGVGWQHIDGLIYDVRTRILGLEVAPPGEAAAKGDRVNEEWVGYSKGAVGAERLWRLLRLFVYVARELAADPQARQFRVLPIGRVGRTRLIRVDTRVLLGVLKGAQVCACVCLWCHVRLCLCVGLWRCVWVFVGGWVWCCVRLWRCVWVFVDGWVWCCVCLCLWGWVGGWVWVCS